MKKNPCLLILGFPIAGTITQAAFQAVHNARQNEVVKEAATVKQTEKLTHKEPLQQREELMLMYPPGADSACAR